MAAEKARPARKSSESSSKRVRPRTPRPARTRPGRKRKWSAAVTRRSNALDLEPNVFTVTDARAIAKSLKRSAEASKRRKGTPFQSAMSMLNLYINRAGRNLPRRQKKVLEQAKGELRRVFGRVE
jgi:hypothetical protein